MKNKKVYIRLICSYFVIFSIPLIMNVIMLNKAFDSEQQKIKNSVYESMKNDMEYLDSCFSEMDMLVKSLSANPFIKRVAQWEGEAEKYRFVSVLQDVFLTMQISDPPEIVEEYYLYFDESNLMFSSKQIFLSEDLTKNFFRYDDLDWESWRQKLKENRGKNIWPEAMIMHNGKKNLSIMYAQPLVTQNGIRGTFVFMIQSETILNYLNNDYIQTVGGTFLLDGNDRVLVTMQNQDEKELSLGEYEKGVTFQEIVVSGEKADLVLVESEERELVLAAVISRDYIASQIKNLQMGNLLLLFLVLLVGFIFVLLFSWYRGRNIDVILQTILGVKGGGSYRGDELLYISDFLQLQVVENEELQEKIEKQKPLVKKLLLERILHGNVTGIEKYLEQSEIQLVDGQGLVLIYQLGIEDTSISGNIGDCLIYKEMLVEQLKTVLHGSCYFCDIDLTEGVLISNTERIFEGDREQILANLRKICDAFLMEYGMEVRIVLGKTYQSLEQIGKSYEQAREMLRYGLTKELIVLDGERYLQNNSLYFFPASFEERLINYLICGNINSIHDMMKELYETNVIESKISSQMMRFLVNDMQCAVLKALHELEDSILPFREELIRKLEELTVEKDVLICFQKINRIVQEICELVQNNTENQENDWKKTEIENYISSNYTNGLFSLDMIAEEFGYEKIYFSKLFKNLFHENFTAYLERLRIEKVCELLMDSLTLEEIVSQSGYNNVATMRKAFMRVKGMNPNEYRKMYSGRKMRKNPQGRDE